MFIIKIFVLTILSVFYVQSLESLPPAENGSSCTFKTDINPTINIEQCIDNKFLLVKSDILTKLTAIVEIVKNLQKSTDENKITNVNQAANITDLPCNNNTFPNTVLKSTDIQNRLDILEKKLVSKFEILEMNFNKQLKELTEIVKRFVSTKNFGDAISSEKNLLEPNSNLNNTLFVTENITSHQHSNIELHNNITNTTKEEVISLTSEHQFNTTAFVTQIMCNSSTNNKFEIPDISQDPRDDFDDKFLRRTTCNFIAVKLGTYALPRKFFNGRNITWFVGIRAQDKAYMEVEWGDIPNSYGFLIGNKNNTITGMWERSQMLSEISTPGILSSDRYVPFYLKLSKDTLIFGKACTNEQLFVSNITLAPGQEVKFALSTLSEYGAKFLNDCPNKV